MICYHGGGWVLLNWSCHWNVGILGACWNRLESWNVGMWVTVGACRIYVGQVELGLGPVIGMVEFCGLVGIGWNVGMLECG